jgi:hypothetical protein
MKVLFRIGLVCGLALVAVLAAANHASARTARAACTPGSKYVGFATYTTYCGPAHVSFKIGSKKYSVKGGTCAQEHNGPFKFGVHIGTQTTGVPKSKYDYFQLDAQSSSPGTFKNTGVTWQFKTGSEGYLRRAKVVLYNGMKKGSFSGKYKKIPVTGTFYCG